MTGSTASCSPGSAHCGIAINRKLASNPGKLVALELGGNNPIVVWDTPKLSDAAAIVVQSAFTSAGNACSSARRLIVKSTLYDAVISEVRKLADRLIVGAPFDSPSPFMGPVIDDAAADGLTESFVDLLSNGGRAIKHMARLRDDLPFVSPAIIDVTKIADRPDVELFGPLLQVVSVNDFDEAIAEANNTRFGLTASLIGGTPQEYNRFWANMCAGVVNWNRATIGEAAAAPFGGVGFPATTGPALTTPPMPAPIRWHRARWNSPAPRSAWASGIPEPGVTWLGYPAAGARDQLARQERRPDVRLFAWLRSGSTMS